MMQLSDPLLLGKMILFHRKKGKLSRNELARLSGVGKTVIYDIEHGKLTIQFVTLIKILNVLNIQIEFKSPLMNQYEKS